MEDGDYLKLLSRLKCYLSKMLEFDSCSIDPYSKQTYPVMLLGDIKIHCNHDTDLKVSQANWERRKKK